MAPEHIKAAIGLHGAVWIALLCCGGAAAAETVFFTHRIGDPPPPAKSVSVTELSSGTARVQASAAVVAPSGGSWLSVTPNDVIASAALRISVNPEGLSSGRYTGFISLIAGTGASVRQIGVTLSVTAAQNTSRIVLSPDSLNFSWVQPDPNAEQSSFGTIVKVSSDQPTSSFVISSSVSWLSAHLTDESELRVIVDTRGLPAGLHSGVLTVAAEDHSAFATLPVSVRIYTAEFNLDGTKVDFSSEPGTGPVLAKEIHAATDQRRPSSTDFRFTLSVSSSPGNWIYVSQSSSSTPSTLNIQVSPNGLKPGTHMAVVILKAEDSVAEAVAISVSLTIRAPTPFSSGVLSVSRNVMSFRAANSTPQPLYAGGAVPPSQANPPATYTSSILVASGNNWLSAAPPQGSLPATISVSASAAGLSEEICPGFLIISPGDGLSVQNVLVLLMPPARTEPSFFCDRAGCVIPTGGGPLLLVSADQLSFTQETLTTTAAPQTLSVTSFARNTVKFKAEARIATPQGGNWLAISPETGDLPAVMDIGVNADGLSPGSYVGFIVVSDPDSNIGLVTIAVLLTVPAPETIGQPE